MRERTNVTKSRGTVVTGLIGAGAVLAFAACNSLDEPSAQEGSRNIVPIDIRPAQQALTKLPAISGGTLAVSTDGRIAIAADPDRDRVSIVDLQALNSRDVAFEAGDEPGRVVVDGAGHAYVALRSAGDIARIDIASAQVDQRTHVCAAPRGMAIDPLGMLHVACADGRLASLNASDGSVARELDLKADLRDVIVRGDHLLVSTFKGAQLLVIDKAGKVVDKKGALQFRITVPKLVKSTDPQIPEQITQHEHPMQSHIAWRMVQAPNGDVVMLHQGASEEVVDITKQDDPTDVSTGMSISPYGGGGSCSGIVTPAMTTIDNNGRTTTTAISMGPLTVDMAVEPTLGTLAVVQAGKADAKALRPHTIVDDSDSDFGAASAPGGFPVGPGVFVNVAELDLPASLRNDDVPSSVVMLVNNGQNVPFPGFNGCLPGQTFEVPGQATAVAYAGPNALLVQSREPALITKLSLSSTAPSKIVELGGPSVLDTGHEIFHRDAGGGIACVSCHAEGAEDGHTWKFTGLGDRRTQALHVGLAGTAPFHWGGDERDLGHLMEDVFVGRMGGIHQSGDRLDALTNWLFSLKPPAPSMDAHADAAVRGKALFESASTGCTNCHTGAKLTNNKTVDVGTGGMFQVPSLVGIGYRAPLMHTGCAATLEARFDPSCGGSKHGNVEQLSSAEVDDMVAYLRTL